MIESYNMSAEEYYRLNGTLDARRIEELLDLASTCKDTVNNVLSRLENDIPAMDDYRQAFQYIAELVEELDVPDDLLKQQEGILLQIYKEQDEYGADVERLESAVRSACYDLDRGFDFN